MNDELKKHLKMLAEWRGAVENAKALVAESQSIVDELPEYVALLARKEALKTISTEADEMDKKVRELAIQEWKQSDKTTKKFPGFSVTEPTVITILDEKRAKIWASTNAPSTVTLTKDFNKSVENLELDFVKVEKGVAIRINSDLSEFISNDEHNS